MDDLYNIAINAIHDAAVIRLGELDLIEQSEDKAITILDNIRDLIGDVKTNPKIVSFRSAKEILELEHYLDTPAKRVFVNDLHCELFLTLGEENYDALVQRLSKAMSMSVNTDIKSPLTNQPLVSVYDSFLPDNPWVVILILLRQTPFPTDMKFDDKG